MRKRVIENENVKEGEREGKITDGAQDQEQKRSLSVGKLRSL